MCEKMERMEMKTHVPAVMASAGWPMLLGFVLMTAFVLLILPLASAWPVIAAMGGLVALTFLLCLRMYLGTYLFLPANEFKGARIIARLGRNQDLEISGVLAGEIIVKQGWMEKLFKVCHIRQKGTAIYLRGVKEPEKVRAWVERNFPETRQMDVKKGKKK